MIDSATALFLAAVLAAFTAALADASPSAAAVSWTDTVTTAVAGSAATTTTQTSTVAPGSSTTQTSTPSQATSVSPSSSGQSGVHPDPYTFPCAPYGSVYGPGSPYAYYTCPCAYSYSPGHEYSYGYYYACPYAASGRVGPKHSIPRPKTAAVVNAEPVSLPLTGENAVLVALLGAGIAGAGVVIRLRVERC